MSKVNIKPVRTVVLLSRHKNKTKLKIMLLPSYNGGQKCWDLSSDITKTSDIARGSGAGEVRRYKPKGEQKIVLRSRVLRYNCLEGLLTQSQVLLSFIVANVIIIAKGEIINTSSCSSPNLQELTDASNTVDQLAVQFFILQE